MPVLAKQTVSEAADSPDSDELFEMGNLFPGTTGLPMTVWVSPRGNARHDVGIKVHVTHGTQMSPANSSACVLRRI